MKMGPSVEPLLLMVKHLLIARSTIKPINVGWLVGFIVNSSTYQLP